MPKELLKRYTPDPEKIKEDRYLRYFARFLEDPYLFHLNRRSVSRAFAVGLFWGMIPMPVQMVAVAITSMFVRINLPIGMALVWISNPLTMPPIFYFNYLVGTWILGEPKDVGEFEMSLEWFTEQLDAIWLPLYFGSAVVGTTCAILGYMGIRAYWRWYVIQRRASQSAT
jgi:uncharacterized protein (DUF2062 family)